MSEPSWRYFADITDKRLSSIETKLDLLIEFRHSLRAQAKVISVIISTVIGIASYLASIYLK